MWIFIKICSQRVKTLHIRFLCFARRHGEHRVISPVKPNPASGNAELLIQISKPGGILLEIRNMLGQVVYSEIFLKQPGGLHSYSIDTGNMDTGVYLCTVTYKDRQHTQRIAVY